MVLCISAASLFDIPLSYGLCSKEAEGTNDITDNDDWSLKAVFEKIEQILTLLTYPITTEMITSVLLVAKVLQIQLVVPEHQKMSRCQNLVQKSNVQCAPAGFPNTFWGDEIDLFKNGLCSKCYIVNACAQEAFLVGDVMLLTMDCKKVKRNDGRPAVQNLVYVCVPTLLMCAY